MSRRNQGAVPTPREFRYSRQGLHMPNTLSTSRKRGRAVSKDEIGGLGDMKMDETNPTDPMAGVKGYHGYNKKYIDPDASDPQSPEFAPHVGKESGLGFERSRRVHFTPEQETELLNHLHAVGHHQVRAFSEAPEGASREDLARHSRLQQGHSKMSQAHFSSYLDKFKRYSGQPASGYSPGSWDMLLEGHDGSPGEPHTHDSALKTAKSEANLSPEGGLEDVGFWDKTNKKLAKHQLEQSKPLHKSLLELVNAEIQRLEKKAGVLPDGSACMTGAVGKGELDEGKPNLGEHLLENAKKNRAARANKAAETKEARRLRWQKMYDLISKKSEKPVDDEKIKEQVEDSFRLTRKKKPVRKADVDPAAKAPSPSTFMAGDSPKVQAKLDRTKGIEKPMPKKPTAAQAGIDMDMINKFKQKNPYGKSEGFWGGVNESLRKHQEWSPIPKKEEER